MKNVMQNNSTNQLPMVIGIQGLDKPVSLTIGKNNQISIKVDGVEHKVRTIQAEMVERRGRKVDPN